MFWELLQIFRRPKDFLGCPRPLLGSSLASLGRYAGVVLVFSGAGASIFKEFYCGANKSLRIFNMTKMAAKRSKQAKIMGNTGSLRSDIQTLSQSRLPLFKLDEFCKFLLL